MATKIVTKNSSTGGSAPSASDLVQGELAVNVTDKRLYTENNAGAIVELGTNPSTIDINAGTIDGTVIGGATAAAGTFTTLTATAGSTITTADNTTQLTLTSTDADANVGPALDLYRNSGSPADSDRVGIVRFQGENDAGQTVNYAVIETLMTDVTDGTEDAQFDLRTIVAGSEKSRMSMVAAETVINQGSADLDFRVESDGNADMLFVNGEFNTVGIGTTTYEAAYQLHILGSDAVPNLNLLLQSDDAANATSQITMYARTNSAGNKVTNIVNSAGSLIFGTNDGAERLRIETSGAIYGSSATGITKFSNKTTNSITVADDATVAITSGTAGAVFIHVYDQGTGDGGVFFATYRGATVLVAESPTNNYNFSTADTDGAFCVYKNGNTHAVTFKNRTGASRNMAFLVSGSNVA